MNDEKNDPKKPKTQGKKNDIRHLFCCEQTFKCQSIVTYNTQKVVKSQNQQSGLIFKENSIFAKLTSDGVMCFLGNCILVSIIFALPGVQMRAQKMKDNG